MSRKFIEQEGRRWTELGIVTPVQYEQILHLYSDKKHAIGLIPILGSILVGLGILSFVAANWQDIPQLARLLIIFTAMLGFYGAGEGMLRKDHEKLGIAFIGLGLITFGAGIILIAQMFHLEAYDATSWIVWGAAGVGLTYLYQSRYLFLITALLLAIAQWYSVGEFHQFSYAAAVLWVIGLGYYAWKKQDGLLVWLLSINFIVQSIMLVTVNDWKFIWVFVPILALYTLGDCAHHRKAAYPLQSAPLIAAFLFDLFIVWFTGKGQYWNVHDELLAATLPFITVFVVLMGLSLFFKMRSGRAISGVEWVLMPILLYATDYADVVYLLVLFFFSLFLLWRGFIEEGRFKINLATILFLCSTMTAYGKLTWDFMDKSLFFILGGILLLVISWFVNQRKKALFKKTEEGNDHAS